MKAREGTRPPLSADSGKFTGLYSLVCGRDGGAVGTRPRGPFGRGSGRDGRITEVMPARGSLGIAG